MKCQKCENGLVLVPEKKNYYEEGNTTRKMKYTVCKCCGGDYRDCLQCEVDSKVEEQEGE
jgi:hypothetical protein